MEILILPKIPSFKYFRIKKISNLENLKNLDVLDLHGNQVMDSKCNLYFKSLANKIDLDAYIFLYCWLLGRGFRRCFTTALLLSLQTALFPF